MAKRVNDNDRTDLFSARLTTPAGGMCASSLLPIVIVTSPRTLADIHNQS